MWLAHSAPPKLRGKGPQSYENHVAGVRHGAGLRAEKMLRFAAGELTSLKSELLASLDFAAEFHDLGKLDDDIQVVLGAGRGGSLKWDHMDAGIAHAMALKQSTAAWLIRAHHSPGLSSEPKEQVGFGVATLRGRRDRKADTGYHDEQVLRTDGYLPEYLLRHQQVCGTSEAIDPGARPHGLTLRLLLSCLVDADHSDTAVWDGEPVAGAAPPVKWAEVRQALDRHIARLESGGDASDKNKMRSQFYTQAGSTRFEEHIIACEAGVGLGKTTSVTRHLLNYAEDEGLRHLFVVAPYTNILRQTGRTLRKALGDLATDDFLCENHHRAEFANVSSRQYSALWKAPITLTTTVQFFETLASNHPAQLRKLHELPGSVIFLDEAHAALPAAFWPQAWRWLRTLTEEWNCRIVLASGSMIRFWEDPKIITPAVKLPELTPHVVMTENRTMESRRVRFEKLPGGAINTARLTELMAAKAEEGSGPILCILNTVQSAAVIAHVLAKMLDGFDALESGVQPSLVERRVLHLSTALSPLNREMILQEIESRTKSDRADWILVATSCVEAGVDLDFQTGYRERCSVASLIQTSGRVNRHGTRVGSVLYDFTVVGDNQLTLHPGFKVSAKIVETMWSAIVMPDAVPSQLVTLAMQLEIKEGKGLSESIIKLENSHDYPEVADEFRIITSDTRTVVVDKEIVERVENRESVLWPEIMRNSVQLWSNRIKNLGMEPVYPGSDLYVWNNLYDPLLLGVMQGILPLVFASHGKELIVDNIS
jgi:CRISPR-associated endonuclease/helicase Cas3